MTGRLFIRTEASTQTGMGHFMRCFAVAETAVARNIPVHFLVSHLDAAVTERCLPGMTIDAVGDFGPDVEGMKRVILPDDWLLIDSYKATAGYIAELHGVTRVAVLDDLVELDRFDCDLLINPAMAASFEVYGPRTAARMLLGPDYALIRREFREPGAPLMTGPSVAVMFGGSDPTGLTPEVARRLHDALPDVAIKVIIGPASQQLSHLEILAEHLPRLHLFWSPDDVGRVLACSDLVVTAAGGSVGEVAAMGLPALVLVVYDNQKAALTACPFPVIDMRTGLPDDLAARVADLLADDDRRHLIATRAHEIVDGRGVGRILEAMGYV